MFVVLVATFVSYVSSEKQIDRAHETRRQADLLADELRQSSDDLTRMVRTYVATSNPLYKRHYQEILDIRDGKSPRPVAYQDIYWDLVRADDQRPRPMGPAISLLELMRRSGFTEKEFAKLAEAKTNSDELTRPEFAAMELIESASLTEENRAKASLMLFDTSYHDAKAGIMLPISEFRRIADQRTLEAVDAAKRQAVRTRIAFVTFGLLLLAMLWMLQRQLHAILGSSVEKVYARIAQLGSGDWLSEIPVAKGMENSVLGWLSETQIKLARLDTQRKRAELQNNEANEKLAAGMVELERLNGEARELSRMGRVLQVCNSVEEACAAVVQSGQILFPREIASLYLMRSSRNQLRYAAGWGRSTPEGQVLAPESCWALRHGHVYCFEQGAALPCEHVSAEARSAAYICVPLVAQSEVLGLLHIRFAEPPDPSSVSNLQSRLQLATTFADQAGLALANLNLRDVLKQQSLRDPLTSLHNRRFLQEALERELARAQRTKTHLTLIMADIDHFKRFNDQFGHEAGDAVLRSVAVCLKSLRGSDMACRFGGEEFTLVLPETTLDAGREKAELLRQTIAALVVSHEGCRLGPITMSFGAAAFPEHGLDAATLLKAADNAMYRAKSAGRNRVETACAASAGAVSVRANA